MSDNALRTRIAALAEQEDDPALAALIYERGRMIEAVASAEMPVPELRLPADLVRARLASGTPLLDGIDLPVPAAAGPLFERLAVSVQADPQAATAAETILAAVRGHRLHVEQLVGEAIVSHADHLDALARAAAVDADLLAALADLTSRPLLAAVAHRLRPALRLGEWHRGYCPICGAQPTSGEQDGDTFRLRCGRCTAAWAWTLPTCPGCQGGTLTARPLERRSDDGAWTLLGCDACMTSVNTIQTARPASLGDLLTDDLASWILDRAALRRGYWPMRRPARRLEHGDPAGEEWDDD